MAFLVILLRKVAQYIQLPEDFVRGTRLLMGEERFSRFMEAFNEDAPTSIRVNPRLISNEKLVISNCDDSDSGETRVPWCPEGYYLSDRPQFTFDPLFHAGCYYVQEAASMFITHILNWWKVEGGGWRENTPTTEKTAPKFGIKCNLPPPSTRHPPHRFILLRRPALPSGRGPRVAPRHPSWHRDRHLQGIPPRTRQEHRQPRQQPLPQVLAHQDHPSPHGTSGNHL